ncbi:MAG: class I SAM-dependent methyltransferase [Candidatus Omnitrophica bacterium]|nr:class I SAM-dependent methyltransferase [Candidatus Omnitrophota bacterium]
MEDFRTTYGEKPSIRVAAQQRSSLWPEILAHLRPSRAATSEPARLMDVGCGYGDLLSAARDEGWVVSGIELNPAMREECRRRSLPVDSLPLLESGHSEEFFQAITYINVLDSIPDPGAELRQALDRLTRGGRILIRVPNGAIHGFLLRRLANAPWLLERFLRMEKTPLNEWIFHPRGIVSLLERSGFHEVAVYPSTVGSRGWVWKAISKLLAGAGRIGGLGYPLSTSIIVTAVRRGEGS